MFVSTNLKSNKRRFSLWYENQNRKIIEGIFPKIKTVFIH